MDWQGKRAIVLGAETGAGRAVAQALAGAGARLAVVAGSSTAEAAFAVQRLARRLSRPQREPVLAQAIEAANDMAVRVMVRQTAKALGGLDALFFCADLGPATPEALALACRYGSREMKRAGGGAIVAIAGVDISPLVDECLASGVRLMAVTGAGDPAALAAEALRLADTGEAGTVVRPRED